MIAAPPAGGRCGTSLHYIKPNTLLHSCAVSDELLEWDLASGERRAVLRKWGINRAEISPDGTLLCLATQFGLAMYHFPVEVDAPLWYARADRAFCEAKFSRDGRLIATVQDGAGRPAVPDDRWSSSPTDRASDASRGLLEIRDAQSGALVKEVSEFAACADNHGTRSLGGGLSFSQGLLAATGRGGGPVRLLSIDSDFQVVKRLTLPDVRASDDAPFTYLNDDGKSITATAFDPAGKRLAVGAFNRTRFTELRASDVFVWSEEGDDWSSPPLQLGIAGRGMKVVDFLGFSHSGRLLCVAYMGGGPLLWDVETGSCIHDFKQACSAFAFSPADDALALAGYDGRVTTERIEERSSHLCSIC